MSLLRFACLTCESRVYCCCTVVLGVLCLVFSTKQIDCRGLRQDLLCVECDVKPAVIGVWSWCVFLLARCAGDNGDKSCRHVGPGVAAAGPTWPQDRVSDARPPSEATHLCDHHGQDELERRRWFGGLRRAARQNQRRRHQRHLSGGELLLYVVCTCKINAAVKRNAALLA